MAEFALRVWLGEALYTAGSREGKKSYGRREGMGMEQEGKNAVSLIVKNDGRGRHDLSVAGRYCTGRESRRGPRMDEGTGQLAIQTLLVWPLE